MSKKVKYQFDFLESPNLGDSKKITGQWVFQKS